MVCRPHHETGQPVCLDCSNLPTDCNASFRKSRFGDLKRDSVSRFGDPVWSTQTQTNGWPAVCGSNRRTYANTCFLHIVNCLSNHFVDLSSPKHCETPGSGDSTGNPGNELTSNDSPRGDAFESVARNGDGIQHRFARSE